MKYLFLISIIGTFFINNTYSQSFGLKTINFETSQNISFNKTNSQDEIGNSFHADDRPKYSYSYGLGANIFESERISLSTNISYTNIGFSSKKHALTYGSQIDPRTGFTGNTTTDNMPYYIKYNYQFNYIDLNIGTNYFITTGNVKLYAHLSPEFNYLLNFKHITKTYNFKNKRLEKDVDDRTESYNIAKTNLSINGGVGIEFNITRGLSVKSQVNYKQMLFTSTPKSITQDKLYSYGLKIGLNYRIN